MEEFLAIQTSMQSTNLLELLEKILDKGMVIAGDIKISLADVELLTIKIRLIVASVNKRRKSVWIGGNEIRISLRKLLRWRMRTAC